MKKITWYLFLSFSLLIVWICLDQYLFCPRFTFASPTPFSGKNKINPYAGVNIQDVSVANFHGHTEIWNGLTNGKGTAKDLHGRYDSMGHDFHAVSQYHSIDTTGYSQKHYLPAYEHGYNINKTHQLVLGSEKVVWKDYLFPQTIHNKQDVLIRLAKDTSNIVVVNHPAIRNGYTYDDLKKLRYYDYIELLNPSAQSISHWDTILSAGKRVFAMGNDDVHNVFNNNALGRFITLVYGAKEGSHSIYPSLRKGASASIWLPQVNGETLGQKRNRIDSLKNILSEFYVIDSLFVIKLNAVADSIKLITDNGKSKVKSYNNNYLASTLLEEESYWRVEVFCSNGSRIFFNPIYRNQDGNELARNGLGIQNVSRNNGNPALALFLGLLIMILGTPKNSSGKRSRNNKKGSWYAYLNYSK